MGVEIALGKFDCLANHDGKGDGTKTEVAGCFEGFADEVAVVDVNEVVRL